jgi:hypothetical protein
VIEGGDVLICATASGFATLFSRCRCASIPLPIGKISTIVQVGSILEAMLAASPLSAVDHRRPALRRLGEHRRGRDDPPPGSAMDSSSCAR